MCAPGADYALGSRQKGVSYIVHCGDADLEGKHGVEKPKKCNLLGESSKKNLAPERELCAPRTDGDCSSRLG